MTTLRGKIVALDVGDARIGIAACDEGGFLASPVTIIRRDSQSVDRIREIAHESGAVAVLIGLPLNMDGSVGFQAKKVQNFAKLVEQAISPIPVLMEDERESTMAAREMRLARGTKQKKRRSRVDAEAAAIFLQAYIDRAREESSRSAGRHDEV